MNNLRLALRAVFLSLAFLVLLCSFARTIAQAPGPVPPSAQTAPPAAIPMGEEHHHHIVFENSYVHVYFVEIPAHDETLYHHHDFPYISVPPGGADAVQPPPGANVQQGSRIPHVAYAAGDFSHAVTNSSDRPLRNVAVELIRPQGAIRNRCEEAVRGQALVDCDMPSSTAPAQLPLHYALFETDEVLVEYWELGPNATIAPADDRFDSLIGDPNGVVTPESSENGVSNPALWIRGGLLWVPALSKGVFKMGPDGGHYIAIKFKDSAPLRQSE